MFTFTDYYDNTVRLSFEDHPFSKSPMHVWVICRYHCKWLLTEHKRRGMEFPGGKVELGELPRQAAIREVREETGAIIDTIYYLGQYEVKGKGGTIVKNIYYATIKSLEKQSTYYETNGPVLVEKLPNVMDNLANYSFMMKDNVLVHSLKEIEKFTM